MLRASAARLGLWLRHHPLAGSWALRALPDFPVTINIPPIGPFRIRVRRNRSFWLRDPLTLETFPLAALQALMRPGYVVYDVGANIGLYTRFLAHCFRAARVVAFEPMTENLAQLRANIDLGSITDRVTVVPYALADSDGQQELQEDDLSTATAALSSVTEGRAAVGRRQYGLPPKSELVTCRRLDSAVTELNLPVADVIKVDIEGAESLFLSGATDYLKNKSPKVLMELHGADKAKQAFTFLSRLGYCCAAKVSTRLDGLGYCKLNESLVERAQDLYDIHFLIASKAPQDLPDRLEPFRGKQLRRRGADTA
jgi:FkbM family methyltransferase